MNSPLKNQNNESPEQEDYNLMHDNPVVKHATWMAKHAVNSRMSPLNDNHDKMTVYEDRKNPKGESQIEVINKADSDAKKAISDYEKLRFPTEDQYNTTKALSERPQFVRDSIKGANVKMDKLFADIKSGKY